MWRIRRIACPNRRASVDHRAADRAPAGSAFRGNDHPELTGYSWPKGARLKTPSSLTPTHFPCRRTTRFPRRSRCICYESPKPSLKRIKLCRNISSLPFRRSAGWPRLCRRVLRGLRSREPQMLDDAQPARRADEDDGQVRHEGRGREGHGLDERVHSRLVAPC